ncbi:MAG: hypothetical protein CFE45_00715, partial [Burkholderiales bacterium PBB5]
MDDWLRVRVAHASLVAEGVREFVLEPLGEARLRTWRAGAHVRLRAQTMLGQPAERRYSLVASAQGMQGCAIAVHRAHDHGVAANLHDCVKPGDTLAISQPSNDFAQHQGPQRAVLIAGGIGITPILPMAYEMSAAGRDFELHYAARSYGAMAYRAEAEALRPGAVHLYLGDERQRLDIRQLVARLLGDEHVYVWGPPSMIDEVRDAADKAALPSRQVHFESFGQRVAVGDRSFAVELRRSGRTLA